MTRDFLIFLLLASLASASVLKRSNLPQLIKLDEEDDSSDSESDQTDSESDQSDTDDSEEIPATSFSCEGKRDGFYADIETGCKVFHYCQTFRFPDETSSSKDWSFLCPQTTIFRQQYLTCSAPNSKFRCEESEQYYDVNEDLPDATIPPGGQPTLPPPPEVHPPRPEPTRPPPISPKPPSSKPPTSNKPTTRPPTSPTAKPTKPTTRPPTSTTPIPTETPAPEEETSTELPSVPESPEFPHSPGTEPQGSFLLPPFDANSFQNRIIPAGVSPYLALVPSLQPLFWNFHPEDFHKIPHLIGVKSDDKRIEDLETRKEFGDLKIDIFPGKKTKEPSKDIPKILEPVKLEDGNKPLTLEEYLKKTSWENLKKKDDFKPINPQVPLLKETLPKLEDTPFKETIPKFEDFPFKEIIPKLEDFPKQKEFENIFIDSEKPTEFKKVPDFLPIQNFDFDRIFSPEQFEQILIRYNGRFGLNDPKTLDAPTGPR